MRPAGPDDYDTVAQIDATAFGGDPATDGPWFEPLLGDARADVAHAELDGAPVATAYTLRSDGPAGPALYLAGVAVLPQARRRGVGAAISGWLLERGFARGAALAHLHPDTDEAARLYARLGFTETPGLDVYVEL
jgi:GNAT superfamily N-acetyltransferase